LHTPCELRGASAQRQCARCEFPVRRTVGAPAGLSTRIGQTQVADVTVKRAHYSAHYTAHYYRTIRLYVMRCKCGETVLSYHGSVVLGRMDGCNDCLCVAYTLYGARDANVCSNVTSLHVHICKTVESMGIQRARNLALESAKVHFFASSLDTYP